jgi:hypothetical protein
MTGADNRETLMCVMDGPIRRYRLIGDSQGVAYTTSDSTLRNV